MFIMNENSKKEKEKKRKMLVMGQMDTAQKRLRSYKKTTWLSTSALGNCPQKLYHLSKMNNTSHCDLRSFCLASYLLPLSLSLFSRHAALCFRGQAGCFPWACSNTDLNPYSYPFFPEVLSLQTNMHSRINSMFFFSRFRLLWMLDSKTAVVFPLSEFVCVYRLVVRVHSEQQHL